jgi:hypothetical protein
MMMMRYGTKAEVAGERKNLCKIYNLMLHLSTYRHSAVSDDDHANNGNEDLINISLVTCFLLLDLLKREGTPNDGNYS